MPSVVGPDECAPWMPEFPVPAESITARGPFATAEFREAKTDDGSVVMWARMNESRQDRLTLAYLGDFVPSAVLRAAGRSGGGTSLDNNIRYGAAPADGTEWILIETEPYLAHSGNVSGAARLWSGDGRLLAVTAQTAVARLFD
jgi:acyl-CoA thioesterase